MGFPLLSTTWFVGYWRRSPEADRAPSQLPSVVRAAQLVAVAAHVADRGNRRGVAPVLEVRLGDGPVTVGGDVDGNGRHDVHGVRSGALMTRGHALALAASDLVTPSSLRCGQADRRVGRHGPHDVVGQQRDVGV